MQGRDERPIGDIVVGLEFRALERKRRIHAAAGFDPFFKACNTIVIPARTSKQMICYTVLDLLAGTGKKVRRAH